MIKINDEYIKYFTFIPASHKTTRPLKAIKIDVPRSGWDITRIIGIKIIVKAKKNTSKWVYFLNFYFMIIFC